MEENEYSSSAFAIAVVAMAISAMFMAAAPLIFIAILYQGGFDTVPVRSRSGDVISHVNNTVVALLFSGFMLFFSALVFFFSKKAAAKFLRQRDAA